MKKPYLRKMAQIGQFKVWEVDGHYVRNNIDIEFTNFGQPYRFKCIPKNELWIDQERAPGEAKYFIDHLLHEYKCMAAGFCYHYALERANAVEKKERDRSAIMKKIKGENKPELIKKIHIRELKNYSRGGLKIWLVNGELIRSVFYLYFTEGGHDKVYNFVPEGEVWLDDDLGARERKFVLLHELYERSLMTKGMIYEDAHHLASKKEYYYRQRSKHIQNAIKKMLA